MFAGLSAELYYVREGVINEYALNFVVPVPAKIDSLHFTWESLADKSVSIKYFLISVLNPPCIPFILDLVIVSDVFIFTFKRIFIDER